MTLNQVIKQQRQKVEFEQSTSELQATVAESLDSIINRINHYCWGNQLRYTVDRTLSSG